MESHADDTASYFFIVHTWTALSNMKHLDILPV